MAKINSTSLFSNSGLHSAGMKALILVFVLAFVGCGGIVAPKPVNPNPQNKPIVITSAEVNKNIAETWTFENARGELTWVDIIPVDENHTTWHYRKIATGAYWAPTTPQAELWFDMEKDSTGAWYSTGGVVNEPIGCSVCVGPIIMQRYPVATKAGQNRPYLIIPADSAQPVSTAIFDDMFPIGNGLLNTAVNEQWQTFTGTEFVSTPVYTGMALISDQWEGVCIHEKWWFAPGFGMVKVAPLFEGVCALDDPDETMVRIN